MQNGYAAGIHVPLCIHLIRETHLAQFARARLALLLVLSGIYASALWYIYLKMNFFDLMQKIPFYEKQKSSHSFMAHGKSWTLIV